jgi:outer membrane protein TolC
MNQFRAIILLICPFVVSGCQRYSAQPLDFGRYDAALATRDPAGAEVVVYARSLAQGSATSPTYDPADGLSVEEAEVVALFFNPALRLARLKANVPRVGAAEAGRWEDPELGIDGERIIESVEEPWVLGGMLSFTIPLSGRLGVEKERAHADATAAELRALSEERRVLAELRAAWVEWSALAERGALARGMSERLDRLAQRAGRLQEVGELGPLDARLLRIEQVKQAANVRRFDSDGRVAELRIRSLLGLASAAGVKLVPSLAVRRSDPPGDAELSRALVAHPRVRVAQAEYEVAERTLKLEIRKQYPDVRLGGGFGTDEGDERVLFGGSLPIPLFNMNRRAIAEARAGRDAARAAAEAEYEQVVAEAGGARATLDGARDQARFVEEQLAPLADRQVEDAVRLGQAGEFDTLILLEALKAAHEAKLDVLDARVGVGLAQRRLDALLEGGRLGGPSPDPAAAGKERQ